MIIIGYPGVGKSYAARGSYKVIDLDSVLQSGEERYGNWYLWCANIAVKLSKMGYVVCVSSHKDICFHLTETHENVVVAYPIVSKEIWVKWLRRRWLLNGFGDSNSPEYKAYKRAIQYYDDDIKQLKSYGFDAFEIGPKNESVDPIMFEDYHFLSWFLSNNSIYRSVNDEDRMFHILDIEDIDDMVDSLPVTEIKIDEDGEDFEKYIKQEDLLEAVQNL